MPSANLLARLAALLTFGYAAYYLLKCTVSPFGRCRRCSGTRRTGRKFARPCPRCDGTGLRQRLGRRLIVWARSEYRDGTR
ncbi:hypothetical protein AB0M43_37965 [Longispora sp. NPDC051575]|uniref:hypothetical protein n=1 Tax=Longispora sp. NPDC051575 TaxID=3154943 RepID=UPI00341EB00F